MVYTDKRRKKFAFKLSDELEEAITDLFERYDKGLSFDCQQENIRTIAHTELNDEESQEVLDYYYRRDNW